MPTLISPMRVDLSTEEESSQDISIYQYEKKVSNIEEFAPVRIVLEEVTESKGSKIRVRTCEIWEGMSEGKDGKLRRSICTRRVQTKYNDNIIL